MRTGAGEASVQLRLPNLLGISACLSHKFASLGHLYLLYIVSFGPQLRGLPSNVGHLKLPPSAVLSCSLSFPSRSLGREDGGPGAECRHLQQLLVRRVGEICREVNQVSQTGMGWALRLRGGEGESRNQTFRVCMVCLRLNSDTPVLNSCYFHSSLQTKGYSFPASDPRDASCPYTGKSVEADTGPLTVVLV